MLETTTMRFEKISGTQAGLCQTESRSVVVDRPAGIAGGQGLGFDGGELFAASLGACFWNDLHYAANRMKTRITVHNVVVEIDFDGTPVRATAARILAKLEGERAAAVFDAARGASAVVNSISPAIPVSFALGKP